MEVKIKDCVGNFIEPGDTILRFVFSRIEEHKVMRVTLDKIYVETKKWVNSKDGPVYKPVTHPLKVSEWAYRIINKSKIKAND